MRVSIAWLKELVNFIETVDELAEKLSMAGFEVEDIDDLSSNTKGVVVGFVEKKELHPNADKLSVCQVNIGNDKPSQIVCGAKNVKEGIKVPVATVGTFLPAKAITIKTSELRGITSQGMICSMEELGCNSTIDGIAELDELNGEVPDIGEPVGEFLGLNDTILELAITANRPDGMSMLGIAHEVSALTQSKINYPENDFKLEVNPIEENISDIDCFLDEGIYSITSIKNIEKKTNLPSYISQRIEKAGIRSISPLVDIANYVMLELGQPLHIFDADTLEKFTGKKVTSKNFRIRKGNEGEAFNGLDGKSYKLNEDNIVITCHDKPVAIAGIIGAQECSVSNSTKNIWLESAIFPQKLIRKSSRKIGLRTESSSRYEKGIPTSLTRNSIIRVVTLLKSFTNFEYNQTWIYGNDSPTYPKLHLRRSRIHQVLGPLTQTNHNLNTSGKLEKNYLNQIQDQLDLEVSDHQINSVLTLLGCATEEIEDGWLIQVPAFRSKDLVREIDLIEEIARLIGFDKFETYLPDPISPGGLDAKQKCERLLRNLLINSGLQEVISLSLVNSDTKDKKKVELSNPLLSETSALRTSFIEDHLSICERNINSGQPGVWIYEIGKIFNREDNDIKEKKILSGIICGERTLEKWTSSGKLKYLNYYEARGILKRVFNSLKLQVTDTRLINDRLLHPGRSALLTIEGKPFGKFGQIHPSLAHKYNITNYTYAFEIKTKSIIAAATRKNKWTIKYKSYATVPSIERDISLLVDKNLTSSEIVQTILKSGKKLLEKVELIDRYESDKLDNDKLSLAFRLTYRDKNTTLTEQDITPLHDKVRDSLIKTFNAELRS